jgi:LuxR family maltose regulon positive regulatory protein
MFIVPLDDERLWYRYHQLFADLLRERLHRLHPEWSSILHQKASSWFEQHGFDDEAIEHALWGDDFEHAAEIIDQHIDDIWGAGQHAVIQRWVANLPDALVFSKPHLCIFHAWYLFVNGQREAAKRALDAAQQAIKSDQTTGTKTGDQGVVLRSDRMRLQGRAAAIQAFMDSYSGDLASTIQNARIAYEYLPRKDLAWRCLTGFVLGDALLYKGEMGEAYLVRLDTVDISKQSGHYYLILIANLRLAETLRYQGKLRQVTNLCKEQMQFIDECGISQTVAAGWLLALWGDVLAERNVLDQAIQQAQTGVEVAGLGRKDVSFFAWSNLYLLRVLFSQGDMTGAEKVIEKMQKILQERDLPILAQNLLSAWQLRIWVHQNKLALADQWVKERNLNPQGELSFFNEGEYLAFARLIQAQGNPGGALELLQRLLEEAESGGRTLRVLEILILQALCSQEEGNMKPALETLEKALRIAEPEGFIRLFLDEGQPMEQLLKKWKTGDEKLKIFIAGLLGAYGTREMPEQPLIEPLSERELEVLELIAEGFTNSEIATRLYLSLNTVKVHTRNIYQKLGVNNRTQAAAKAREFGILSSS